MISKQILSCRSIAPMGCFNLFLGPLFFLYFFLLVCGRSFAQELNSSVVLDGQRIDIEFLAMDLDCSKKVQSTLGKMFCGRIQFKTSNSLMLKDLVMTRFNLSMPQHRHGLVTKPVLVAKNSGEYLIHGLKLHMAGDWQMDIEIKSGKSVAQVAIPLKL